LSGNCQDFIEKLYYYDGVDNTKPLGQFQIKATMNSVPQYLKSTAYIFLTSISLLVIGWAVYSYLPLGVDWYSTYRPAALEILNLRSPYNIPSFFNAPWILLPILPIAFLPEKMGFAVMVALKKRSDQTSMNYTLLKKGISYYNQAIQKQKGLKHV
jgi:hypothetical protein